MTNNLNELFEEFDRDECSMTDLGRAFKQIEQWLANSREENRGEVEDRLVQVIWRLRCDGIWCEPKSENVAKKLKIYAEDHKDELTLDLEIYAEDHKND